MAGKKTGLKIKAKWRMGPQREILLVRVKNQ